VLGIGPKTQSINSLDKNVLQGLRRDLHAKRYITREQNRARKTYRECRKRQLQSREPTYTTMESDQQATIALESFQYSRLLYTDSIRLLILELGEPSEKLVFRMELTGLTRTPRAYTAVSYVWGNHNDTIDIFSKEGTLSITKNLYDTLHRLRLSDKPRRIWVNTVCINQADIVECGY